MHLKAAIKLLNPKDNVLPRQKQFAPTLLNKCHQELQSKVNVHMKGAISCLISGVWANIKDDSIMNYMTVSKEVCLFLESVSTGLQGHNHQFIAGDIICIIQHNTSMMFAGAVIVNTFTNKKAWELLQQELSSCYFHGCCYHGLHLLVKDIITATKTKKNSKKVAMYPSDYPL